MISNSHGFFFVWTLFAVSMTPDTSRFRWSDAWLFLAIGYSSEKGESSLARVIGVADGIQHSVLTWEEVDGGLFRLGKAGYVVARDGKLNLTQQGRLIFEGLQKRTLIDRLDELTAAIGAPPWTAQDPAGARDPDQPQIVGQEEFEEAVSQYIKRPARTLGQEAP